MWYLFLLLFIPLTPAPDNLNNTGVVFLCSSFYRPWVLHSFLHTFYIGKTIRNLATRVKEHGSSNSAIYSHLLTCETCKSSFSCNNFSVIDSGKNDFEVTIKEAFHIKFSKPIMNKQLFTQGSSFVLNVF